MLPVPEETGNRETFMLFGVGIVAGLIHLIGVIEFGRGFEMVQIARNLADYGTFANPFDAGPTGFTAVNPPLYPLLLALCFKLLHNPTAVAYFAAIGGIAANAVTAALLPRVSLLLFTDRFPGIVASIACLAAMQLMPAWDTNFTIAGMILLCVFSAETITRGVDSADDGVLAGLAAGGLVLMNPSSLMVTLPWIAWVAIKRRAAAYSCALMVALCLVVSMWVMRNDLTLGAPVLRTNFGMTVYASNNDCAAASLRAAEDDGCYEAHHPNTSREEARLVRTLGEVGYDRKRTADTVNWMTAHPGRFRRLTVERVWDFWFPSPVRSPSSAVVWLVTWLSVPGLILMAWRREQATFFVLAVLIAYPLMYYIVVSDTRYRYPILWISGLAAGYFVSACRARMRSRWPALLM